jgi:hypothetical protein
LKVHWLPTQEGELFAWLQAMPQCPQLRTSSLVETQSPPQQVPPFPHGVLSTLHDSTHFPLGLHFAVGPASVQSLLPRQSTQRWAVVLQR